MGTEWDERLFYRYHGGNYKDWQRWNKGHYYLVAIRETGSGAQLCYRTWQMTDKIEEPSTGLHYFVFPPEDINEPIPEGESIDDITEAPISVAKPGVMMMAVLFLGIIVAAWLLLMGRR